MNGRRGPADVEREVAATAARQPWTLPASWYEPGTAERMADWIRRNNELQPTT